MQIDLKLVEAFSLIVRCGSLAQAERESGQSKATLSGPWPGWNRCSVRSC